LNNKCAKILQHLTFNFSRLSSEEKRNFERMSEWIT